MIFVFGSNAQGHHAGGAAAYAVKHHGAEWGIGEGMQGESYAIPTMEGPAPTAEAVTRFLSYAANHSDVQFKVTRIGCGIAGYTDQEIAPMFNDATSNCHFDSAWEKYLPGRSYWGTV